MEKYGYFYCMCAPRYGDTYCQSEKGKEVSNTTIRVTPQVKMRIRKWPFDIQVSVCPNGIIVHKANIVNGVFRLKRFNVSFQCTLNKCDKINKICRNHCPLPLYHEQPPSYLQPPY